MSGQIFINGRFLTQPLTGVQRYARELLRALDALNPDTELICLAPPEDFPRPTWKNIAIKVIGKNRGNLWEQVDLPLWLKGRLLFSPTNSAPAFYGNQAVTIHDASIFAVPQAYSRMFKAKYRVIFGRLAKNARRIFTDSVFSQGELSHYLRRDPSRFDVILLGGDHMQYIRADESILDELRLRGQPYMLMVASQSPHKNTARLLQALNRIQNSAMRFVVVGGSNNAVFQKEAAINHPSVIATGYKSDEAIKALYEHARGFIFPSLYEGFGLPVLEAMNCGCPVLSSRAASLPEVGGDAVLYFDPLSVDDIASAIDRLISSDTLQDKLRQHGRLHAAQFTWNKTAQQTLDLLTTLL
jgi:glycosyltransferase involved in cell wall biosynthesis